MLGNIVGQTTGKRIVRRVLSVKPPTVEVTFEDQGAMLGVEAHGMGTYTSEVRADGTLFGEGQGAYMSAGGDMLAWKGWGLGKFGAGGSVSYRGILFFQSTSPKWAPLNTVACVFEYEVDADGGTVAKVWEWK